MRLERAAVHLADQPQWLAVAVGGLIMSRGDSRLRDRVGRLRNAAAVGRTVLIWLVVLMAVPHPSAGAVRVLGADDFSLRKRILSTS